MKTPTIAVLVVASVAAIIAIAVSRRPLPVGDADHGAPDPRTLVAQEPENAPSPNSPVPTAATEPHRTETGGRTPSSPSFPYAEPEEIEAQLGQFIAAQPGLAVASLSSIDCVATSCEVALIGTEVNPRHVGAYSDLGHTLFAAPWPDFRILFGGIGTREVAPGAREYVISFEYQPLVDLSTDPLMAARQSAACASAWRRQTENPTPPDVARGYLDQAERYVTLAASVLGEQEAARVAAETRGGPLIRECGLL